jgi:hypothetical protein
MLFIKPPARIRFETLLVLIVVAIYATLTVVHSQKWKRMAEINTRVLGQIRRQHVDAKPNTFFLLTYTEADRTHLFPDGFASWGFPAALKLLYKDQTVNGLIMRESDSVDLCTHRPIVYFRYVVDASNRPHVIKGLEGFQEMANDE